MRTLFECDVLSTYTSHTRTLHGSFFSADSDLLGSKRKQRNPQKVVSPDRAPSAAKHVASPDHVTSERVTRRAAGKPESQPEADVADPNLGDQDAAQNESKDPDGEEMRGNQCLGLGGWR